MALVTPSIFFTNIKGSVAGTTFSSNRAGLTAKTRLTGKRNTTQKQAITLNQSLAVTNAWNALPNPDKILWNNYALANTFTDRYGVIKQLTGFQWFKQINSASYFLNASYVDTPPAYAIPDALPSFEVNCDATDIVISPSMAIDTATTGIYVYTTPPNKANANFNRGLVRLTDIGATDYSGDFSIRYAWEQTHGLNYGTIAETGFFMLKPHAI